MDQSPKNNDLAKNEVSSSNQSEKGFLDELESDPNEDPEALLAQAIPDLDKEMKQLQSDFIGLNADIDSIEFGEEPQSIANSTSPFKVKFTKFRKKSYKLFSNISMKLFYTLKYLIIWIIFELPKKLLKIWKRIANNLNSLVSVFKNWSGKRKLLFTISIAVLSTTLVFYFKLLKGNFLSHDDIQFYGSMEELAEQSVSYDINGEIEPFYNSPRVKVYSFKMKPVVVNLKRNDPEFENPMAYFEFVFIGNTGDVVVELKENESEFIDLTERSIEKMTYESLDTPEGKEELKADLKKEINKRLSDGVIKRIELHNFFIKP